MKVKFALLLLAGLACSRGKQAPVAPEGAAGAPVIGQAACYDTSGATACPPDKSDPSGKGLPASGSLCLLPPCKPCGSATAPASRDSAGKARPGWCICVPRSDDSGQGVFSCFGLDEWAQRFR
jgi:hypothetical protein